MMVTEIRVIETGSVYHIYNRGVEKRQIFSRPFDYHRFLETLVYYQQATVDSPYSQNNFNIKSLDPNKLFSIIVYCLMPNHFHLVLKQLVDGGIQRGISQILNSYTRYFNTKYDRTGHLFQNRFQSVRVGSDEQLLQLFRYILLNPYVDGLAAAPGSYRWSAYREYFTKDALSFCSHGDLANYFSSKKEFKQFILNYADEARARKLDKKFFMY